jgi:hypothetical protein
MMIAILGAMMIMPKRLIHSEQKVRLVFIQAVFGDCDYSLYYRHVNINPQIDLIQEFAPNQARSSHIINLLG